MSKLLHDHSPWLRSTPVIVEGSNKGIELWQKNKDQGVFVLAFNVATMGEYVQGIKTFKEQGPRKDQGLLCLTTMLRNFWLSKATSGVSTPADLKGKKMALGMPGTNSLINAQDTLQLGLGLKPGTDYFPKYVGIDDIVGLLKEGTVDAVSWGEMSVRGIPYAYVDDLANYTKLNFISFKQEHIDKINKGAGMDVYILDKVTAGTYKNQSADVFWVTSPSFSTLPLMYSEDVAYEWTRVWWSFWDEGTEISKLFGLGAPEMTREALKQKWPFTWHPGALKYYKEKGWI